MCMVCFIFVPFQECSGGKTEKWALNPNNMFRFFHSIDNIIHEIILIHDIVHVGSKVNSTLVLYWFVLYLFLVSSLQF
jgi:hypothetical protein